jgi:predicted aspartyl protease
MNHALIMRLPVSTVYYICTMRLPEDGLRDALIDTGAQVSLVVTDSLIRGLKINEHVIQIHA